MHHLSERLAGPRVWNLANEPSARGSSKRYWHSERGVKSDEDGGVDTEASDVGRQVLQLRPDL